MEDIGPRLLDLFCGAGGAAMGYHRAGFNVTGIDIEPQPHYPFKFIQAEALSYLADHGHEYDAIHASPPCQAYSIMHNLPWLRGRDYPLLILPTLEMLATLGRPYIVENVMGARHGAKGLAKRGLDAHGLKAGWLCGAAFGLPFYRHRLFAANWLWLAPGHPKHQSRIRPDCSLAGRARDIVFVPGHPRSELWAYGGTVKGLPGGVAGLDVRPRQVEFAMPALLNTGSLAAWQRGRGAQDDGVGIGHARGWRLAAEAMGIDWMRRTELTQAIPPAYTEWIGWQLMKYLGDGR